MVGTVLEVCYCHFNLANTTPLCEEAQITVLNYRTAAAALLAASSPIRKERRPGHHSINNDSQALNW